MGEGRVADTRKFFDANARPQYSRGVLHGCALNCPCWISRGKTLSADWVLRGVHVTCRWNDSSRGYASRNCECLVKAGEDGDFRKRKRERDREGIQGSLARMRERERDEDAIPRLYGGCVLTVKTRISPRYRKCTPRISTVRQARGKRLPNFTKSPYSSTFSAFHVGKASWSSVQLQ